MLEWIAQRVTSFLRSPWNNLALVTRCSGEEATALFSRSRGGV